MIPSKVFMGYTQGKTCYFISYHPDGRVLDAQAKAWVTFNEADIANYFMTYTEFPTSGFYSGSYPSDFELDILPTEVSYQQAGVSPVLQNDTLIGVGQSQGSNVAAISTDVESASNQSVSGKTMAQGTVQAGSNTTQQIVTDFTDTQDNLYRGRVVIFTSGAMNKGAAIITGYNGTTKVLSFTLIPTAPSPGDTFVVV